LRTDFADFTIPCDTFIVLAALATLIGGLFPKFGEFGEFAFGFPTVWFAIRAATIARRLSSM
jgi:hypothetical protein